MLFYIVTVINVAYLADVTYSTERLAPGSKIKAPLLPMIMLWDHGDVGCVGLLSWNFGKELGRCVDRHSAYIARCLPDAQQHYYHTKQLLPSKSNGNIKENVSIISMHYTIYSNCLFLLEEQLATALLKLQQLHWKLNHLHKQIEFC